MEGIVVVVNLEVVEATVVDKVKGLVDVDVKVEVEADLTVVDKVKGLVDVDVEVEADLTVVDKVKGLVDVDVKVEVEADDEAEVVVEVVVV